jgi:hypothetical protein
VRLSFRIRDLLAASWTIERQDAERLLPSGLEPATVEGEYLVSLIAMRHQSAPRHRQINVRTYVRHEGEDAVYFLLTRVTAPGLLGVLLGAPYGLSRIAVARGSVEAPGLGVSIRYRVGDETSAGPIGALEVGFFGRSRLKRVRIRRGPAVWRRAELDETLRADPILAYGIAPAEPSLLYAEETLLELEGRPSRLRISAQSGKIGRPGPV